MRSRLYPSRTVREVLDTCPDDAEFRAFAEMLMRPPPGVEVMKPTAEEWAEIRERLKKGEKR